MAIGRIIALKLWTLILGRNPKVGFSSHFDSLNGHKVIDHFSRVTYLGPPYSMGNIRVVTSDPARGFVAEANNDESHGLVGQEP